MDQLIPGEMKMKLTGGQIVVRALEAEGIPFTFGIPGTHNIELYDALAASTRVTSILVTDEQSASFMADAVWRASGRLGCANLVPGAGLTHALSGIAEAFMDNVPLLVLGCGIRRDTGHAFQLHDIDQLALVRPITKAQFRPLSGDEIYPAIREACRIARAGAPGPVFVEIPANFYLTTHEFGGGEVARGGEAERIEMPGADDVARAVDLLRSARQPLLYLGLGAAGAGTDLIRLAELLGAPVATTFQGKGVFPESHPLALWPGFGAAAPPFARKIAAECDLTLAIGCKFGEVATGSYGVEPPRPLVHIDIDPAVIGRNFPADLGIVGDAAVVVRALLEGLVARRVESTGTPHARGKIGRSPVAHEPYPRRAIARSTRHSSADEIDQPAAAGQDEYRVAALDFSHYGLAARIHAGHRSLRREWEPEIGGPGVTPGHLFQSLQLEYGPETIFTADSGNGTFLAVEHLRLERPGLFLAPVDYSCMGYAVPAAIGAKLARPESPVVALAGDGAFLMTGLELLTAAALEIPILTVVLRDRELAQISQFQETALNRKANSVLPDYDVATLCAGLGVETLHLHSDDAMAITLARATEILEAGRPVVIDCAIDYSRRTYFTRGVVRTNLLRLPWPDRLRFITRAVGRRVGSGG